MLLVNDTLSDQAEANLDLKTRAVAGLAGWCSRTVSCRFACSVQAAAGALPCLRTQMSACGGVERGVVLLAKQRGLGAAGHHVIQLLGV